MSPRIGLLGLVSLLLAPACSSDGGVADVLLVARVEVTPPSPVLTLQESLQLEATPKTEGGLTLPARSVTWSSSAPLLVSVSETGLVRALGVGGPVAIRATVEGVPGEASITVVPVPVDHITIAAHPATLLIGAATQLSATAFDAGGTVLTGRTFLWESGAPSVAPVTTTGLVFGQAEGGPVTITASTGGKSATSSISVIRRPPARLGFLQQPGPAIAGQPMVPAIRVAIQDDLLGTVTNATNPVTIALAGNPGGSTLTGTKTVAAVNGIATFNDLRLDRTATGYTLLATSSGLISVTSMPFDVSAGSANRLGFVVALPATARSGVALSPQPSLQLRDGAGNPVPLGGVVITASIASGPGALGGSTTATTNSSGTATFSSLSLVGKAGSYTVGFSAAGILPITSAPVTLTAGLPASLSIKTQPSSTAQSGVALTQQPEIQLLDLSGNPVSQAGVAVTVAIATGPPGGSLGGIAAVTTNAGGQAGFSNLSLSGPSGSYTLGFSGAGMTGAASNTIVLSAGAGTSLAIVTQPSTAAASGAVFARQPVIQLRDAAGNPVALAGVVVAAFIQTGGGSLGGTTTAATDGSGAASFTNLSISGAVGDRTLIFAASGYVSAVSGPITVGVGAASQLSITTQPSSSAPSGVAFAQQPVVQVTDGSGNPVGGVLVTVAIASGGGTLGGAATATSGASGAAGFSGLSITGTSGPRTLSFSAAGASAVVSSSVTITAGSAGLLSITTQPSSSVQSGVAFPQQPVIQVSDASGNGVGGVVVSVAMASGTGTLGGTLTATTSANGAASFSGLSITGTAGNSTLSFSAPGLTPVTSGTIAVGAGAASQLSITTQPSSPAQSGVPFAQQPVVQVTDASNNPVGGVVVTAAIASGGGALGGALTATSSPSGAASFSNLSIAGATGNQTLSFSAAGAIPVVSSTITLTAGPPSQVSIITQPSSPAQSGVPFAQQPVVQVTDASNNPVPVVAVTAAIASGGGTLGGTLAITTNAGGVASFNNLAISGIIGKRTLSFSAGAVPPVISGSIDLTAGPASQLSITTQPSAAGQPHDSPFGQQPVIQLLDSAGNPVSQGGVFLVTAAKNSGPGSLKGTRTVATNSSGVATYGNLEVDKAGNYTLKFTSTGLTQVISVSFAVP